MQFRGCPRLADGLRDTSRPDSPSTVAIEVDFAMSVQEAETVSLKGEQALREHVPLLGGVVVRVCPGGNGATPYCTIIATS
jgi:divalent metal cation (Fe/Co/Zn/Cd) transporter